MCPGTSEVHDLSMQNLHQTQELVIDLRRAKEADAQRHRLVKGDDERAGGVAQPCERRPVRSTSGRQSLARA